MKSLIPFALILPLALSGCDDGADQIASLNQQLEAERVKITDLETRAATVDALQAENAKLKADLELARGEVETASASAFDVKTIEEPISVAFVRLRETDRELRDLRRRFNDDPDTLQALGALRTKLRDTGRELGRVAESAKIDLATTVGD